MAVVITSAGKYDVTPGETYIIDPSVAGTVEFRAGKDDPRPVDFKIVLQDSPTHSNTIKIYTYGSNALSPELVVADGYKGPKTEIEFRNAADSDVSIGADVVIKAFEVSERGQDRVTVGAFDRGDLVNLGALELDGNNNGSDGDQLIMDISWLTPEELAQLEAALAYRGYVSDGEGGWQAGSKSGGKVDVKFDLDGDGKSDFELKLHHWEEITLVSGFRDFVVSGTNGDDLIDLAYDGDPQGDRIDAADNETGGDEDLVDAGAGNDTVYAGDGDDTIYAGSGDDVVYGESGNDVIYGDRSLGTATGPDFLRESLNWTLVDDPDGTNQIENGDPITGFTQNTGTVDVTFSILTSSAMVRNTFDMAWQNIDDIDAGAETVNGASSFLSEVSGAGNSESYELAFSNAVENVAFRINDIDGGGVVRVLAFDVDGTPVEISLTAGSNISLRDTDAVPGADTAESRGGYDVASSPEYSMLVEIPGPVARIVIEHSQTGTGTTGVSVTDVFFDAPQVPETQEPGNDTLYGGDGDDLIFGEGGDDVIFGGNGNDTLRGNTGDDSIRGGDGDDFIFGGKGNDTLRGNDGDDSISGGDGDDVIFGGHGNDTLHGGAGNDTIRAGLGDDLIFGGDGDDLITGGPGADTLYGGFGNDTFRIGRFTDPLTGDVHIEGVGDVIVGGEDPDGKDVDTLDLSEAGPLKIVFDDAVDPTGTPGESGTVTFFTDDTWTTVAGTLTFREIENVIPCFTPGALIATPKGEVPVERLREGDKVITRDNGIQEIRWTGHRTLSREELARAPNLKPVLIKAGSLGYGLPERDMLVSPQHRMLIAGDRSQLYFEESEVLVAAKHLLNTGTIQAVDALRATYIHFMFDRHEVILCNGAWTESFQPGEQTLGAMGQGVRDEIVTLFPELATREGLTSYSAARRSLKAHEARLLQQ